MSGKIQTTQTATGRGYTRIDPDGRVRTYSSAEIAAAASINALQGDLQQTEARKRAWERAPRATAKKILTAQEATDASRRTLGDTLKAKKKPVKPKVDKFGWPVKAETEKKEKKEKNKPISQPNAERSTGFILPSVVVGGFSAHLNSPERWDVSIYKTATLSNNFVGFDLPEIKPIKEHLADLQKKLLGLSEDDELEESEECKWDQFSSANSLFNEQRARGVSYSISCKARMTGLGFNRLKEVLGIQSDGTQFGAGTANIELLGIAWAGAFNGPSSAEQFEIYLPPHILEEDGAPSGGARAMILRHDGTPPVYISKSSASPPSYANVAPDLIQHDLLDLKAPTETPAVTNRVLTFDLDFLTIDQTRWGVAITRHV